MKLALRLLCAAACALLCVGARAQQFQPKQIGITGPALVGSSASGLNPGDNVLLNSTLQFDGSGKLGVDLATPNTWTGLQSLPGLPGLSTSVNSGGPGLSFVGCSTLAACSWNIYSAPTTAAEAAFTPLLITRDATGYSGGTSGDTIDSLHLFTKTAPGGNYYDWPLLSEVVNETAATTAAQNVAIQASITKTFPLGDSTERSASWAINGVCTDNFVNPTTVCTGMELDVNGDGTDASHNRSGLTIVAGGTSSPHIGAAMQVSATSGTTIDNLGLFFGDFTNGFEFGGATFAGPPIQLGAGQQIAFDAPGDGSFNRSMYYTSGSLAWKVVNNVVWGLADSGATTQAGFIETTATTTSTSTTTGSGIFGGGLGVAGAGFFGGAVSATGNFAIGATAGITKTCSVIPTAMTISGGIITSITGGTCT